MLSFVDTCNDDAGSEPGTTQWLMGEKLILTDEIKRIADKAVALYPSKNIRIYVSYTENNELRVDAYEG